VELGRDRLWPRSQGGAAKGAQRGTPQARQGADRLGRERPCLVIPDSTFSSFPGKREPSSLPRASGQACAELIEAAGAEAEEGLTCGTARTATFGARSFRLSAEI
jgi:hypothetical protein